MRAAGLRTRSAEAFATERLAFHDRPDLVAVHVEIADAGMLLDIVANRVDAALKTKRQAVAGRVDVLDDLVETLAVKSDDVEKRSEILAIQFA